jgi:hypothetical protein
MLQTACSIIGSSEKQRSQIQTPSKELMDEGAFGRVGFKPHERGDQLLECDSAPESEHLFKIGLSPAGMSTTSTRSS